MIFSIEKLAQAFYEFKFYKKYWNESFSVVWALWIPLSIKEHKLVQFQVDHFIIPMQVGDEEGCFKIDLEWEKNCTQTPYS